jgi:hypothetical protein
LDHLVDGAIAAREEFVGEAEGNVVNDFGFLEGEKSAVVAPGRE